jgi:hypothetical protein
LRPGESQLDRRKTPDNRRDHQDAGLRGHQVAGQPDRRRLLLPDRPEPKPLVIRAAR